jgi:MATE family multidrug resistance protein
MQATGFWIGLVLGLTVAAILLAWSLNKLSALRVREARAA